MFASAECPAQADVDVLVDVMQDYEWRMLAGGKPRFQAVRWPRPLDCLAGGSSGPEVLAPVASWHQALRSLLNSATARVLVNALHRCHEAYNDVWQDLWSQRCEGGCVPSRPVFYFGTTTVLRAS